jgi:hypothetical protein
MVAPAAKQEPKGTAHEIAIQIADLYAKPGTKKGLTIAIENAIYRAFDNGIQYGMQRVIVFCGGGVKP